MGVPLFWDTIILMASRKGLRWGSMLVDGWVAMEGGSGVELGPV